MKTNFTLYALLCLLLSFTYPPISLPVNYLSFNAVPAEKAVLLSWTTTGEINNSHFEVERAVDMKSFRTVAIVLDGFDTENRTKNYKLKDNLSSIYAKPLLYYRLKQIDADGNFNYSKIISVRSENKIIKSDD